MNMLFLGLAFAAGILMAVQGTINGLLGKFIGVLEGNFFVHAIGLAAVSVLLFISASFRPKKPFRPPRRRISDHRSA